MRVTTTKLDNLSFLIISKFHTFAIVIVHPKQPEWWIVNIAIEHLSSCHDDPNKSVNPKIVLVIIIGK